MFTHMLKEKKEYRALQKGENGRMHGKCINGKRIGDEESQCGGKDMRPGLKESTGSKVKEKLPERKGLRAAGD